MGLINWTVNKLNPAQPLLSNGGTTESASLSAVYSYQQCYEQLEIVNRGVNMLIDDVSSIPMKIGDKMDYMNSVTGVRKATLERILNSEPNPYQDINSFKRAMLMDFILEGNIFLYFDGMHLYHLPATKVVVVSDKNTYVSEYKFEGGQISYKPSEIIHVKDNSFKTVYRGSSRLEPALRTMRLIIQMRAFQDNFFKNGAVPGLVIKHKETLNQRLKDRLLAEWSAKYRPSSGGKRPLILDGGMEIDSIADVNFRELDFQNAIAESEKVVLKALGIPPVLIDSGNNANLRPNHRLYYLETIIPILDKINQSLQKFFGFEIYEDTTYIEALRPELRDQSAYLVGLVNGGVISANEARHELGKEPKPGHDDLRIPANIAGSAANPNVGGRPTEDDS